MMMICLLIEYPHFRHHKISPSMVVYFWLYATNMSTFSGGVLMLLLKTAGK